MDKLKPCPFCGEPAQMHRAAYPSEYAARGEAIPKDATILREWRRQGTKQWSVEYRRTAYVPQCTDTSCIGRTTKMFRTQDEAAEAWNRRASDA